MMKNDFCFTLKALFCSQDIYIFYVEKRIDQKDQVTFKIYDVTTWEIEICNTNIVEYLQN